MKILIITGNLAFDLIKKQTTKTQHETIIHPIDIPVAAFLTPRKIANEIKKLIKNGKINSSEIDLVLIPGLIKKDTEIITKETGIPAFKGSTDAADLSTVLDVIGEIKLSTKTSADRLIQEQQRKKALQFIEDYENDQKNIEKLLKKPDNIKVRNLPVGNDFPMRVLGEISLAPLLTKEELINKVQYYIKNGADMIDIGMVAGEDLSNIIPDLLSTVRSVSGDMPVSVDTLNSHEIETAVNSGADMILSIDHGNCDKLLPLLEEHKMPVVLLPTNYKEAIVPKDVYERVEYLEELKKKCKKLPIIADLVLDPINSTSIVDSIMAYNEYHKRNPDPLFWGVGNVTELLDADSTGVNSVLTGIGMEVGASILFTPEVSAKTKGSIYELATSSKMMFLAKNRGSIPKDLGINLVMFKDKRHSEPMPLDLTVPIIEAEGLDKFVLDRAGSFKISIINGKIVVVQYKKTEAQLAITGSSAKPIYEELVKQGLVTRMEHASYLGSELQKAEIALKTGKNYTQDLELFKKTFSPY